MTRRISTLAFVAIGILVAAALVVFVAPYADANPDGLEKVSADTGIDAAAAEHLLADGPFADYGVSGADKASAATGIAGVVGIVATFAVGAGVVWIVRRRRSPPTPPADPITSAAG
jgi:cobalt/nickel transport system permease protein